MRERAKINVVIELEISSDIYAAKYLAENDLDYGHLTEMELRGIISGYQVVSIETK